MILAEPPPSQADIHFRIFDIPVRIHPLFWVIALIIALRDEAPPATVLIWVVAVFVSILVHELGHALLQRRYGGNPRIVLHGLGGLAICGDCERSTRAQIWISLAGPGAGFLLALLTALTIRAAGHRLGLFTGETMIPFEPEGLKIMGVWLLWEGFSSPHVNNLLRDLFFINILWGAINLLPIYPLDGGQVARELCVLGNPRSGMILSLRISMIAAIGMAVVGISWQSLFVMLMFGYLAYASYKTLEAYRASLW
ncbi:MAG: site-2 protease family protein [Pirellulales bacterium]|nr:site-2 protease family protein [Pirellulales bacterium]